MEWETRILNEINECRLNPRQYSLKLQNLLNDPSGEIHDLLSIESSEQLQKTHIIAQNLVSCNPLSPLSWSDSLVKVAKAHSDWTMANADFKHPEGEVEAHSCLESHIKWTGTLTEFQTKYQLNPEALVLKLIIEESKHDSLKIDIIKNEFNFAAVSVDQSPKGDIFYVIILAEYVLKSKNPISSSQRSEYVKVKEITPAEALAEQKSKLKNNYNKLHRRQKEYQLNTEEIDEIKDFFSKIDAENSGFITSIDIQNYLANQDSSSSFNTKYMNFDIENKDKYCIEDLLSMISKNLSQTSDIFSVIVPEKTFYTNDPNVISPILKKVKDMSQELINEAKSIFDYVDIDRSGVIDLENLKSFALAEGMSFSSGILDAIQEIDSSQNKLNFAGLLSIISESSSFKENSAERTFQVRGEKGFMSSKGSDERETYSNIEKLSHEEIKGAFDFMDLDKSGMINCLDVAKCMKNLEFKNKFLNVSNYLQCCDLPQNTHIDFTCFSNIFPLTRRSIS